jgi:hypothetical protein
LAQYYYEQDIEDNCQYHHRGDIEGSYQLHYGQFIEDGMVELTVELFLVQFYD